MGGQPFWDSPDILIYPAGTPGITVDSEPGFAQVEADVEYDLYLKLFNDRCADVTGIKIKIFFADPSGVITQADMQAITTPGMFVGDDKNPNGLDLLARNKGLLGPFKWKPSAADAQGNNGHKCLIAHINAQQDPIGPTPDLIANDNNVAQRNIQVGAASSSFEVRNPQGAEADVGLEYNGDTFPTAHPSSIVELSAEFHPALAAAWAGVPGTVLTHDTTNNRLLLQFKVGHVRLPPARLPANIRIPGSVRLVLPPSVFGTFTVHFAQSVNGTVRGGMSFHVSQSQIPT